MNKQQAGNARRRDEAAAMWGGRKAEIERLYHQEGWSQARLAAHYGMTPSGVQRVMERLGIAVRTRENRGPRNGRFKDGSQARGYRKVIVKDLCSRCGATEDLGIHHKNDDHYDNRLENLEVLCNSCHMSITKKEWWDAKRAGSPTPKSNGPVGWTRTGT